MLWKDKYKMNLKTASWLGILKGMEKWQSLYVSCLPFSALAWYPCSFPQGNESKALNLTVLTGYALNKINMVGITEYVSNLFLSVLIEMRYSRKGVDSEIRAALKLLLYCFLVTINEWAWANYLIFWSFVNFSYKVQTLVSPSFGLSQVLYEVMGVKYWVWCLSQSKSSISGNHDYFIFMSTNWSIFQTLPCQIKVNLNSSSIFRCSWRELCLGWLGLGNAKRKLQTENISGT